MRYAVLAGALCLFALYSGICEAEELKDESVFGAPAIMQEDASDAATGVEGKYLDSEYDTDDSVAQVGVMSPGQGYDEDTGLPDVVEDDSSMEL